jgi:hypothetical protein
MTVATSILLAALVGGVMFVLIDSWQRREPAQQAPAPRQEPQTVALTRHVPASAWERPVPPPAPPAPAPRHVDEPARPPGLWAGWARRD